MARKTYLSARLSRKVHEKRIKSLERSVRKKMSRAFGKPSGLKPYNSLFPVK